MHPYLFEILFTYTEEDYLSEGERKEVETLSIVVEHSENRDNQFEQEFSYLSLLLHRRGNYEEIHNKIKQEDISCFSLLSLKLVKDKLILNLEKKEYMDSMNDRNKLRYFLFLFRVKSSYYFGYSSKFSSKELDELVDAFHNFSLRYPNPFYLYCLKLYGLYHIIKAETLNDECREKLMTPYFECGGWKTWAEREEHVDMQDEVEGDMLYYLKKLEKENEEYRLEYEFRINGEGMLNSEKSFYNTAHQTLQNDSKINTDKE